MSAKWPNLIKKKAPLTWREFQTIAAEAGITAQEFYANDIQDNWIWINGHQKRVQMSWEQTRAIAYNVGRFGNCDAKKFPKNMQAFWPLPWDEKVTGKSNNEIRQQYEENQRLIREMEAKMAERAKNGNTK